MSADKLKIYIPAMLLAVVGFVVAFQFVDPAPPNTLIFSAGQKGGAYAAHAESYRDFLKQHGIKVTVLESPGSLENVKRLQSNVADVAFVQSGIVQTPSGQSEPQQLQSLGSMYYEPLWIFLRRGVEARSLHDLKGKRIAVGLPGSGTKALALQLLKENGMGEHNATLLSVGTGEAADLLIRAEVDALLVVSAASSVSVQALLTNDAVHLMSMRRAEAYTRRIDALSAVQLPEGVLSLAENIPAKNKQLIASTATLVVNENLHPALQGLLMQAAAAIHASSSLFSKAGAFPTAMYAGLPVSKTAQRFYTSGPPFLQRFMPFWAATLVDRLKVMLLPFIALLIPLFKVAPPLYRWRIRSRIYRWYEELGRIDAALAEAHSVALIDELDRIEAEIRKVHVPLAYAEELYDLRLHLAMVRDSANRVKG